MHTTRPCAGLPDQSGFVIVLKDDKETELDWANVAQPGDTGRTAALRMRGLYHNFDATIRRLLRAGALKCCRFCHCEEGFTRCGNPQHGLATVAHLHSLEPRSVILLKRTELRFSRSPGFRREGVKSCARSPCRTWHWAAIWRRIPGSERSAPAWRRSSGRTWHCR